MSAVAITETERRVLAHLPAWRNAEGWELVEKAMTEKREARLAELRAYADSDEHPETHEDIPEDAGFADYPRSFTVEQLAERMAPDAYSRIHDLNMSSFEEGIDIRPGAEGPLEGVLEDLRAKGLVVLSESQSGGKQWSMLKAGLEALTA